MNVLRRSALAGALLAAVLLAGCTPEPQVTFPPPGPTRTPHFASDEAALAAAKTAYADYLRIEDQIFEEGGKNPERLREAATGQALEGFIAAAAKVNRRGLHTTGMTRFDSLKLQALRPGRPTEVVVYVCEDVSAIDMLNSEGKSIVTPGRIPRTPLQMTLVTRGSRLIVSREDLWKGQNFCE